MLFHGCKNNFTWKLYFAFQRVASNQRQKQAESMKGENIMKTLKNWKRLTRISHRIYKINRKLGRIAVDYVTDLYDSWGLCG